MLAALLYGITFPLVHDALEDITPFAYLVGRFGIAVLFVAPAAWISRAAACRIAACSARRASSPACSSSAATRRRPSGLQYTSASTSAFMTGLYVVLTPVVEAVVYRRVPGRAVWAGIVLATLGLYLLTGADIAPRARRAPHPGVRGAVRRSTSCTSARTCGGCRRRPFTALQLGMVAVLSVPAAAGQGIGTLTALAVFAVVFTGIACSAIALPLQLWGQRRIPPTRRRADPPGRAGVRRRSRASSTVSGSARCRSRVPSIILVGIAVSELGSASARDTAQSARVPGRGAQDGAGVSERRSRVSRRVSVARAPGASARA